MLPIAPLKIETKSNCSEAIRFLDERIKRGYTISRRRACDTLGGITRGSSKLVWARESDAVCMPLKKRGSLKHLSKHPTLKELCGLPFWGIASVTLEPCKSKWLTGKGLTGNNWTVRGSNHAERHSYMAS
jgi:hypothetical protein